LKKCTFSKIQDGGGRHLEFRKMLIVSANMNQFSPNFNSVHLALAKIDPCGQKSNIYKILDGCGRHLEFRKLLIVAANMKQFSQNFNCIHLALA
jgi:hypothetical protein